MYRGLGGASNDEEVADEASMGIAVVVATIAWGTDSVGAEGIGWGTDNVGAEGIGKMVDWIVAIAWDTGPEGIEVDGVATIDVDGAVGG
jgi:hypothetical protein